MDWSSFKFNFSLRPKSAKDGERSGEKQKEKYERPIAREVLEAEGAKLDTFKTENLTLEGGLTLLKGCTPSNAAVNLGLPNSDLVPGKYEGGLKLWECTVDLIETLRREIQDGRLSFRGKDVLELGCGHGLPGILACIKGAARVHFQDFNDEVITSLTIPNVKANLSHARTRPVRASEATASTPRVPFHNLEVHYFAGDWEDVAGLLSLVDQTNTAEVMSHREAFHPVKSFDDLSRAGSEEGSRRTSELTVNSSARSSIIMGQETELPGSIAEGELPERSSSLGTLQEDSEASLPGGYDVILMSETVYNPASLPKLNSLVKKCLRQPYGVLYVAAKKYYFGVGGGIRQFKSVIEEDGRMSGHMLAEFVDGMSNVREIWKFFFKPLK